MLASACIRPHLAGDCIKECVDFYKTAAKAAPKKEKKNDRRAGDRRLACDT
jgi:hypothetical protein